MAAASISCCIGPPAPPKGAATAARWSSSGVPSSLCRAFAAAAACAAVGMADAAGGGGGADMALALARDGAAASRPGDVAAAVGTPRAKARWSDRRQCPAWRANSLENVVPENLPRASTRRRFSSVSVSAAALQAPAPDLVLPPFLSPRPGTDCFSL
ncbi:uncharacterized protein LOC120697764 [Panicum virgatum]|uniref:Uncharacterized protein n=1 Tax=Panicum virgatum TaxID=38727 RepID=A0A8T0UTJ1_PANVG|nr:uncharacterized protein LOC120697764 [Panicum virgatum]KAG2625597.1 hypothetical protein PVAP13_3KG216700 [Panicum virgatum]